MKIKKSSVLKLNGKTTKDEITAALEGNSKGSVLKIFNNEEINLSVDDIMEIDYFRKNYADADVEMTSTINLRDNTLLFYLLIGNNRSLMHKRSATFNLSDEIDEADAKYLIRGITENVGGVTEKKLSGLFKSNKTMNKSELQKYKFVNFEPDTQQPKVSASKYSRTVIPVHKIDATSGSGGGLFSFENSETRKPEMKTEGTPGSTEGQTSEAKRKRGRPRKSEVKSPDSKIRLQSSEKLTDLDQTLATNPDHQNGQTLNGNIVNVHNNQTQPPITTSDSESGNTDDTSGNTNDTSGNTIS